MKAVSSHRHSRDSGRGRNRSNYLNSSGALGIGALCLLRIPQAAPVVRNVDGCAGAACGIRNMKQKF